MDSLRRAQDARRSQGRPSQRKVDAAPASAAYPTFDPSEMKLGSGGAAAKARAGQQSVSKSIAVIGEESSSDDDDNDDDDHHFISDAYVPVPEPPPPPRCSAAAAAASQSMARKKSRVHDPGDRKSRLLRIENAKSWQPHIENDSQ